MQGSGDEPDPVAQRRLTVSSNPLPTGTPQLVNSGRLRRRATNGASSSACVVVLSVTSTHPVRQLAPDRVQVFVDSAPSSRR